MFVNGSQVYLLNIATNLPNHLSFNQDIDMIMCFDEVGLFDEFVGVMKTINATLTSTVENCEHLINFKNHFTNVIPNVDGENSYFDINYENANSVVTINNADLILYCEIFSDDYYIKISYSKHAIIKSFGGSRIKLYSEKL